MLNILDFLQSIWNAISSGFSLLWSSLLGVLQTFQMESTFLTALGAGMPGFILDFATTVFFFAAVAVVIKIFPFIG